MVNMSLREFLEKREAEVKAARASLLIELKEIKKAQKAISPQEAAGKKEYNTENKFTIKEMIKHVLLDNKAGGKPEEIIRWINDKHHINIERHSLSPQLSRLRAEGELSLLEDTSIWFIPEERAQYLTNQKED
jgi:hypothetical protein